jgi:hypothetical protein
VAATMLIGGYPVLCDSPAFGKQQPCFGSTELEHFAWGMRAKIDTIDPLRELLDKADAHS